jgi:hypothetical protein
LRKIFFALPADTILPDQTYAAWGENAAFTIRFQRLFRQHLARSLSFRPETALKPVRDDFYYIQYIE